MLEQLWLMQMSKHKTTARIQENYNIKNKKIQK